MKKEINGLKILLISYRFAPYVGGIEVNSEILANHFSSFGARVRVLTTTQAESEDTFKFKVIRSPDKLNLISQFMWADIVFENNPALNLSWPNVFFRKKHVVAIRTWISRMNGSISLLDKLKLNYIKSADSVISVSQEVQKRTLKSSIVIGNPYRKDLFRDLNIDRNRDFVFLGRLVTDKGADMAIEMLAILNNGGTGKNYNLTIIGDGEERERLERLSTKLNLVTFVKFTGVLRGQELVRNLNNHKYILVPSKWREPFGNIALEGMACGCLPIVSDGGGLVDAVAHGKAGIIFKRNDLKSLVSTVQRLLSDPYLEDEMRANFECHLEKHAPSEVATKYFNVIKSVMV